MLNGVCQSGILKAGAVMLSCALISAGLSSCQLVAGQIDSFKQLGVAKGDRENLLGQQIKKFYEKLYWNNPRGALEYVADDRRETIAREMRGIGQQERIVEYRIEFVEFSNDSYAADAEVAVRYYRVPYYAVNERVEKQRWDFSLTDGWRLVSREVVRTG